MTILALAPALGDELLVRPAAQPNTAESDDKATPRQCYLPWCSGCFAPSLNRTPDTGHMHTGVETRIDVQSIGPDGTLHDEGQIRFYLERYDDDAPGAPVTGYTHVYLAINGSEGVAIPLANARMFVRTFLGQVEIGQASRHLVNHNEVDPDELREAEAAWHAWVEQTRDDQAAQDAARASQDSSDWTPVVTAYEFGRTVGKSLLGRWFPPLTASVVGLRYRADARKAFKLGTRTAQLG